MRIVQDGYINLASLSVPGVIVDIYKPPPILTGIQSDILGIVGVASWGPVGSPLISGGFGGSDAPDILFGPVTNRKYDLVSSALLAGYQGASNFRLVRATDGTDVAAQAVIQTSCITWTAFYSGTLGNSVRVTIGTGKISGTFKLTVRLPGHPPEQFDNLALGLTGNAVWAAFADAINNGISLSRGPSKLIVATVGVGTAAPTLATATLSGGTDGDGVNGADLVGSDTTPRTGMYSLRGAKCSVAFLADCDDSTTWALQSTFGGEEGIYMILTGPYSETIADAITAKETAGMDDWTFKMCLGDWIYFNDTTNGIINRLISPQGVVAGLRAVLAPSESELNKRINGIVGTQSSLQGRIYSDAEKTALIDAGIDVVCNPSPGGYYFACMSGHNGVSDTARHGSNYTTMTNFLAKTFGEKSGIFVGRLQSKRADDPFRQEVKTFFDDFLTGLEDLPSPMLDDHEVICDKTNNSDESIAAGYCYVLVKAVYLSVVEFFVVGLQGGQTVTVTHVTR